MTTRVPLSVDIVDGGGSLASTLLKDSDLDVSQMDAESQRRVPPDPNSQTNGRVVVVDGNAYVLAQIANATYNAATNTLTIPAGQSSTPNAVIFDTGALTAGDNGGMLGYRNGVPWVLIEWAEHNGFGVSYDATEDEFRITVPEALSDLAADYVPATWALVPGAIATTYATAKPTLAQAAGYTYANSITQGPAIENPWVTMRLPAGTSLTAMRRQMRIGPADGITADEIAAKIDSADWELLGTQSSYDFYLEQPAQVGAAEYVTMVVDDLAQLRNIQIDYQTQVTGKPTSGSGSDAAFDWTELLDYDPASAPQLSANNLWECPDAFSPALAADHDDDLLCVEVVFTRTGSQTASTIWSIPSKIRAGDWRAGANQAADMTAGSTTFGYTTAVMDSDNVDSISGANTFNWTRGLLTKGPNGRVALIFNRSIFIQRIRVYRLGITGGGSAGNAPYSLSRRNLASDVTLAIPAQLDTWSTGVEIFRLTVDSSEAGVVQLSAALTATADDLATTGELLIDYSINRIRGSVETNVAAEQRRLSGLGVNTDYDEFILSAWDDCEGNDVLTVTARCAQTGTLDTSPGSITWAAGAFNRREFIYSTASSTGQGSIQGQGETAVAPDTVGFAQLDDAMRAAIRPDQRLTPTDGIVFIGASRYSGFARSNDIIFSALQPEPLAGTSLPAVVQRSADADNAAYDYVLQPNLAFNQSYPLRLPMTQTMRYDIGMTVHTRDLTNVGGAQTLLSLGSGSTQYRLFAQYDSGAQTWNFRVTNIGASINVRNPVNLANDSEFRVAVSFTGTTTRHTYRMSWSIAGTTVQEVSITDNSLEDNFFAVFANALRSPSTAAMWHGWLADIWIKRMATTAGSQLVAMSGSDSVALAAGTYDDNADRVSPYGTGFGDFTLATGDTEYAFQPIDLILANTALILPDHTTDTPAGLAVTGFRLSDTAAILVDVSINSGTSWTTLRADLGGITSKTLANQNQWDDESMYAVLSAQGFGGLFWQGRTPDSVSARPTTFNTIGLNVVHRTADADLIDQVVFAAREAANVPSSGWRIRRVRRIPTSL